MCGIAGFSTKKPSYRLGRALSGLLLLNESRGRHSTGIYRSDEDSIVKEAISADKFVAKYDLTRLNKTPIALGHTRFATMGAVSDNNSHPFRKGKIVGVHNGIISNPHDVFPDAKVDSEAIFYALDKEKNDAVKAFEQLSGSAALAWVYEGELYLMRHQNPLHVAQTKDGTLLFSSEEEHLNVVMNTVFGSDFELEQLPADTVFKAVDGVLEEIADIEFKKTNWWADKKKTKQTANSYGYGYDNFDDWYDRAPKLPYPGQQDEYFSSLTDNFYFWYMKKRKKMWAGDLFAVSMIVFGCDECGHVADGGFYSKEEEVTLCKGCFIKQYKIAGVKDQKVYDLGFIYFDKIRVNKERILEDKKIYIEKSQNIKSPLAAYGWEKDK